MHLTKHHGLGNDFLVALVESVPANGAELARSWCHRTHGIGADGLIFGTDVPSPGVTPIDVGFTLFHSDGSRAEISGNGMRCFAHAIARHLGRDELELTAATLAGPRRVEVTLGTSGITAMASVEMGPMNAMPLSQQRIDEIDKLLADLRGLPPVVRWATGDMGNPHIVIQVDDPFEVDLRRVGAAIEQDFGGINVHFIAPRDDGSVEMRVWERGAGITEACGSGACAVGAVALDYDLAASPVTVHMPGGSAIVAVQDGGITLTGPSVFVADVYPEEVT